MVVRSETHEISNLGRVRSLDRIVRSFTGNMIFRRGKMLKPWTHSKTGYQYIRLMMGGKNKAIHHLVLEAFVSKRPSKKYVGCHNDGVKNHNWHGNLRWDTPSGNLLDTRKHGTTHNQHSRQITKHQEQDIRSRYLAGLKGRKSRSIVKIALLAEEYDVGYAVIQAIVNNRYRLSVG